MLSTRNLDDLSLEEQTAPMYEKYDELLHGSTRSRREKILTVQFMRKYIHLAKKLKPVLTEKASEIIADEYTKLRSKDMTAEGAHTARVSTSFLCDHLFSNVDV